MRIHSLVHEKTSDFLKRHKMRNIGMVFCFFCLGIFSVFVAVVAVNAINNESIIDGQNNTEVLITKLAWNKINTGKSLDLNNVSFSGFDRKANSPQDWVILNGTNTSIGGTEKITLDYSKNGGVGEIDGRTVGVKLEITDFTLEAFPSRTDIFISNTETTDYGINNQTMVEFISQSFWEGVRTANIGSQTEKYTLYYLDTKEEINLKDSWVSYNSLSTYEGVKMYSSDDNYDTAIAKDTTVKSIGNGLYQGTAEMWNVDHSEDWDSLSSNNYVRGTVAQKLSTSDWKITYSVDAKRFTDGEGICYYQGENQALLCNHNLGVSFLHAPSIATLTASVSTMPEKFAIVDSQEVKTVTNVAPEDELIFETSQQVEYKGYTGGLEYRQFALVDILPEELDYIANSATVYRVEQGGTQSVVAPANYSVVTEGKTIKIEFKQDYLLSNMLYQMETYTLQIKAVANEETSPNKIFKNVGYSIINNVELEHSTVDIVTGEEKYGYTVTTYKNSIPAPGSLVEAGDNIQYSFTIKNTGADIAPYTVLRDYLPDGTSYVANSATDDGVYVSATADHAAYVEWVVLGIIPDDEYVVSYSVEVSDSYPVFIIDNAYYMNFDDNPGEAGEVARNLDHITNTIIHKTDSNVPVGVVLDLQKYSEPSPGDEVNIGDIIKYRLEMFNNGDTDTETAGIRDYIPDGTEIVEDSISENGFYNKENQSVEWKNQSIESGDSKSFSFSVKVVNKVGDKIVNQGLFENGWNGINDPYNSSNIIEHVFAVKEIDTPETGFSASTSAGSSSDEITKIAIVSSGVIVTIFIVTGRLIIRRRNRVDFKKM